ncbi:hypothetical protein MMSR116_14135 [Methylobacterium mesophilicum SR1.6/6]|uniref:3',5'-cyclic-nucleotide phosphodiesterase n=1 Tax=Methylobacterium mesophilicum SR1.6/6 TaxID=908290 RepID=A0A6B9FK26_9HYPH|nr:hypothetical protein [Methylobacterium mesophilicum]QGY02893.1 hypothetical protein MMSR116_14135 [Methylobacterium mesophilicum SR1.6/6]
MSSSFLRLTPLAALVVLLAPLPAPAQGTPRSIGECERLKNDLAYNQCLAMFGPAAKNVAGGYASADIASTPAAAMAEPIPQVEETAEATTSRRRRYRASRGRQYASFSTGYRHRRRH